MGVQYELNWYIVVQSSNDILEKDNNIQAITKIGKRIYPVGSIVPVIIKQKGCTGLAKILSFQVEEDITRVEYTYMQLFEKDDPIAEHYFKQYALFKQNDI